MMPNHLARFQELDDTQALTTQLDELGWVDSHYKTDKSWPQEQGVQYDTLSEAPQPYTLPRR